MNIYIAGKITGLPKEVYQKAFAEAEELIISMGHTPINPIKIVPKNLVYNVQMNICYSLIDISDAVMMLDNWVDSPGATNELVYAAKQEKKIIYYDEQKEIQSTLNNMAREVFNRTQLPGSIKEHYEMGLVAGKALCEGAEHSKPGTRKEILITSNPTGMNDMFSEVIPDAHELFKHQMRNLIIFP